MNGHICSQVVDLVVMDLVQKTAMCAVWRSQGLQVQSILMDHILCRRRFAVPAGVEVISIPIWNSFAFQSVVQEIPPFPPFPPRPSHDSPHKGRAGNPNCLSSSLTPLRNEQIWLWTPFGCNRGLQIRCLLLAETARRESGRITLSCTRCPRSPSLLRNIRHHSFLMSWSFTNQCCCSLTC